MKASQQIEAFSTARVIAGPHGSAMANLAFATRQGGILIELFSPERMDDPIYERISSLLEWKHYWACLDFDHNSSARPLISAMREILPKA